LCKYRKSKWPVSVSSYPESAKFSITNESGVKIHTGATPAVVNLKSSSGYFNGETYKVNFTKEGYQETISTIDSEINGWYFGNLLFGGFIGLLIVDPASGAMFKLPESTNVELTKN
jgi:hypothetical protein